MVLCWYVRQKNNKNDMLDDVNLLVEFVVMSVSVPIRSLQDIYYTIIPSIYVHSVDAVDCSII